MNQQEIAEKIGLLEQEIGKKVIGQKKLLRDILIALFSGGHILLEGVPGLAKTLCVETLGKVLNLEYKRIQFTPDLLPSDLIGSQIFLNGKFEIKKGPIFSQLVLADEINRAPSKVQSALLEAMAEKQVTIGETSYKLDKPFMVLATQNPLEQAGTYTLPEAQLDRFLLKTIVEYPSLEEEIEIMKQYSIGNDITLENIFSHDDIQEISQMIEQVEVSENIYSYVADIVFLTRSEEFLKNYLSVGASPRASISLIKAAKTLAFLHGRNFVLPEDIKEVIFPVMRHRIVLGYEQIAQGITSDQIIEKVLDTVTIK